MGNAQSEFGDTKSQEYVFMQSILAGDASRVQALITTKPDIVTTRSREYNTAWHCAAQAGQLQVLQLLHKDPAVAARRAMAGKSWSSVLSVDHQNKKGQTPLMIACDQGHHTCVGFLVTTDKADPWIADLAGNCAIHYAALKGHAACLQALLANPAPHPSGNAKAKYVNVRNRAGLTPLHCAVYSGHSDAARVLLAAGCRLAPQTAIDTLEHEVACNGGSTPLHLAAMRGHAELVRVLMATYVKILEDGQQEGNRGIACPDPRSIPDKYGLTPFMIATKWGRDNVAPILDPMAPLDITPKSPCKRDLQDSIKRTASAPRNALPPVETLALSDTTPPTTAPTSDSPPPTVNLTVSAGTTAAPSNTIPSNTPVAAATGNTTAWMEEILNRVVPESESAISLPPRVALDTSTHGNSEEEVPSDYICPISKKLMLEPVIAADGCTYDKQSLADWQAAGNTTYPDSSCAIDANMMLPNTLLRAQISQWKRLHPQLAAQHS